MSVNRQVLLKSRPEGMPGLDNFELVERPIPEPGEGELLMRTLYLSLDPYMRGRMSAAKSYAKPAEVGQPMVGVTVGEVVRSRHPQYAAGETVLGFGGWQQYAISNGAGLRKLDAKAAPLSTALGVLGMPGMTAYVGLTEVGQPKPGETVAVSAASGAVGSVVGQIARIKGCRAVGIAGGPEKCRYVMEEIGFEDCVDYKAGYLAAELKDAAHNGIYVYFENVGGDILDTVLLQMNLRGRIPVCGLISAYNATELPLGPRNLRCVLTQRLKMQGLIVFDWANRVPEAIAQLGTWHKEGKLVIREDVRKGGLDAYPEVLNLLYTGGNQGKLVLAVD